MRIDILTLFPNLFTGFVSESIIKRCIEKGLVEINVVDFRKYSKLNNTIHNTALRIAFKSGGVGQAFYINKCIVVRCFHAAKC